MDMLNGNQTELARKEANLIDGIEKMLPDFARACRAHDNTVVTMHQDAFAAEYHEEEYRLLGMAIKFAGICGKEGERYLNHILSATVDCGKLGA